MPTETAVTPSPTSESGAAAPGERIDLLWLAIAALLGLLMVVIMSAMRGDRS